MPSRSPSTIVLQFRTPVTLHIIIIIFSIMCVFSHTHTQHIIISFDCLLSTSLVTSFHFLSPFVSRTPKDEKKNEESTYATSVLAVADSYFHVGGSFLFVL